MSSSPQYNVSGQYGSYYASISTLVVNQDYYPLGNGVKVKVRVRAVSGSTYGAWKESTYEWKDNKKPSYPGTLSSLVDGVNNLDNSSNADAATTSVRVPMYFSSIGWESSNYSRMVITPTNATNGTVTFDRADANYAYFNVVVAGGASAAGQTFTIKVKDSSNNESEAITVTLP
jgi:hypothetical protein